MMTRETYVTVAAVLRELRAEGYDNETLLAAESRFAEFFRKDNDRFDPVIFSRSSTPDRHW